MQRLVQTITWSLAGWFFPQMVSQVKTHPNQRRKGQIPQQFQDIGTSELYQAKLCNCFQALQELQNQEPTRSGREQLKNDMERYAKKWRRKVSNKSWPSMKTYKKVEERRYKKVLNRNKTSATKARVKRSLKRQTRK